MRRARWRLRQRMASLVGLAFGAFAGDVVLGLGVAAGAGDGDAVDRGVDLAVAAAVEAVPVGLARADRDRGQAGGAGELGVAGKAAGAGDLADELGRRQRPEAGLGEQLRRDLGDELGDLGRERLDRLRSSRMRRSSSRAMRTRIVCSARARRRATRVAPLAVEQRAAGQLELGPEIVQMPLQRVVQRDALANESLAVVDQQPQIELRARKLRRRQCLEAFAQRRPRDRDRIDAVGLPARPGARGASSAISFVGTRRTRSPRAIRNRSNDPDTCRQSSSAQTRSPPRPAPHVKQRGKAARADLRPSSRRAARRSPHATAAIVCDRL